MEARFQDRREAGRVLAASLRSHAGQRDAIVLGLPRGGVPVAYEVAEDLKVPLDVFIVRKLGVPGYEELALGAIASGGVRVLNDQVVRMLRIPDQIIDCVAEEEGRELERRERVYRQGLPPLDIAGRTVILIDDGLATGSTMRAAILAVKLHRPARVIVAVPVGARSSCGELEAVADEVVCARMPEPFAGVGQWYGDFEQTTDEEVTDLLRRERSHWSAPA